MAIQNLSEYKLYHGIDESYKLEVRPVLDNEPLVLIDAPTVFGVLRGFQSLLQLIQFGWTIFVDNERKSAEPVFIIENSPLLIRDKPTYSYRGLLMDTSRHYLPIHLILDNINAMEYSKLNVLHWHIVDSQSWPYQSTTYPELSEKGAFCKDCIYTLANVTHVIKEAAMRGIHVIPEFDLPGHSRVIGSSYPEVMSICNGKVSEPLNVTSQEAYEFTSNLYKEVLAVFPDSWVHIGGDEVATNCWNQSADVHRWMNLQNLTDITQLQQYFEDFLFSFLINKGRTPIAWQEVMEHSQHPFRRRFPFGKYSNHSIIVDYWKDWTNRTEVLQNITAFGYRAMVSSCWYLDHLKETVDSMYNCQIWDFDKLNSPRQNLLVGGHASMWGEMVDETIFLPRVWPRTAAVAEVLWTAPKRNMDGPSGNININQSQEIVGSYIKRLANFRCFLVRQGIPASPLGPGFCDHNMMESAVL